MVLVAVLEGLPAKDLNAALSVSSPEPPPRCPITGEPALRRIQGISQGLLIRLWRHAGGVELGHLLRGRGPLGLWESPCGLAFFHPMIEGDEALYPGFYRHVGADAWLFDDPGGARAEFAATAALVGEGELVLDVGCGKGALRRHLPHARYVGLDPYAGESPDHGILAQTIHQHAAEKPGVYDVVCALQVLEHVAAPRAMAEAMVKALRPGGLFVAAVPSWPSPLVEIPNMPANAIPHHLSWWTVGALEALCRELGLEVMAARDLPPQIQHRLLHWTWWFSPIKAQGPYFRRAWPWFASLIIGYGMARLVSPVLGLPPRARSMDCFIAARKPA